MQSSAVYVNMYSIPANICMSTNSKKIQSKQEKSKKQEQKSKNTTVQTSINPAEEAR
jgi:hypothetical protein